MKYPIKPEQLKQTISIKQTKKDINGKPIQDEYGDQTNELEDVFTNIHAFVDPTGGSEFYAAQKVNAEANYNVWIRYRKGILPSMFVVYGSSKFEIVAPPIDLYSTHRWIRLICKELVQ